MFIYDHIKIKKLGPDIFFDKTSDLGFYPALHLVICLTTGCIKALEYLA